jgi:hypothetical protein
MRHARLFLPTLFLLAVVPPTLAAPQLSLTWDTCTGPTDKTTTDPGIYSLNASLIGLDQPTTAYQVWISYGDASLQVPDAWRFDDLGGCQTSAGIAINHLSPPALSKACPSLQGTAPSLQIKKVDFWPPAFSVPQTLMRALLANAYPAGNLVVDPSTRWFLAQFRFDHTFSVVGPTEPNVWCGGFETPICFRVEVASYLTPDQIEYPIAVPGAVTATFDQGVCGAVPARPSTWGGIKAQYRR